jgi:NTE family protein
MSFSRNSPSDVALCLSGGGYRAALFHLGSLRRLNELGILHRVAILTSVSGGSILNGLLAKQWSTLAVDSHGTFSNFEQLIGYPLRQFCRTDIRTNLILGHRINPGNWLRLTASLLSISGNVLAESYRPLFGDTFLRDLPESNSSVPRFVFCATSMNTGACWHFHGGPAGRMGDFYSGYACTTGVTLAEAVAASSAFPLAFAPFSLELSRMRDVSRVDPWGTERPASSKRRSVTCKSFLLTDGGVYDNLGLEPIWSFRNSVLGSDGGSPFESVSTCRPFLVNRLDRVAAILGEQVGAVRKRWLIENFVHGSRHGALWAINTNLEDFILPAPPGYGKEARQLLSSVRTDLNSFSDGEIACLENHGYSLADAAVKSRAPQLLENRAPAFMWPHPEWSADNKAQIALLESSRRHVAHDIWSWLRRPLRSAK